MGIAEVLAIRERDERGEQVSGVNIVILCDAYEKLHDLCVDFANKQEK